MSIWQTGGNKEADWNDIVDACKSHVDQNGIIYIGCDSQVSANKYTYVEAICLHGASGQQGGTYFYKKENFILERHLTMRERITNEASRSIDLGMSLTELLPLTAKIEIHLDVSANKANASCVLSESLSGYAKSVGFSCKLKPESWAAGCVADVHTR